MFDNSIKLRNPRRAEGVITTERKGIRGNVNKALALLTLTVSGLFLNSDSVSSDNIINHETSAQITKLNPDLNKEDPEFRPSTVLLVGPNSYGRGVIVKESYAGKEKLLTVPHVSDEASVFAVPGSNLGAVRLPDPVAVGDGIKSYDIEGLIPQDIEALGIHKGDIGIGDKVYVPNPDTGQYGTMSITGYDDESIMLGSVDADGDGILDANICKGDSGLPVLVFDHAEQKFKVIGLVEGGLGDSDGNGCNQYTIYVIRTR